jgi:arylsulfatase A-like enzyme
MKEKTIKNQWDWKFGLFSTIFLTQVIGFCDFIVVVGLGRFDFSDIYTFLGFSYFWFINCAMGLLLFLISTLFILSSILKKRLSRKRVMTAYLGFPLFLLINLVGLNWLTKDYNILGIIRSWKIIYLFSIFLLASFLSFASVRLSVKSSKRSSINSKVFRAIATCIICITLCFIFFDALIYIAIAKMELYPQQFQVDTGGTINHLMSKKSNGDYGNLRHSELSKKPNLIFISIDTLRADNLSCYGYKEINTHNVDALAQNGVRFAHSYTSIPITLPSHSSMMTGLHPMHHGALYNNSYLHKNNITLAEILREYGYNTAAFVSAFHLTARFNFHQGFNYLNYERKKSFLIIKFPLGKFKQSWIIFFLNSFRLLAITDIERRGEEITASAMDWLKNNRNEPFFIFLHFWDPHSPYYPPKKYLKTSYHNNASLLQLLNIFNPLEKKYSYDGEVVYVNEQIGILNQFFKSSELLKNSIIIFIADHGEGLEDHDFKGHTDRVYEEQLHVPLIIIYPPLIPKGKIIKQPIDIVNIMPTILDMLNIPAPAGLDGSSLMPLINEEVKWNPIPLYASASPTKELPFYRFGSIFKDDWKLICHLQNKRKDQLYYIKDDPAELNNLAEKEKKKVSELKPLLLKWIGEIPKGAYIESKVEDKETIERLKALGYIN